MAEYILLTAFEVAQHLRLNVETVYRLIQKKGLPAVKIGQQWRFVEADVHCWVHARTTAELRDASTEAPRHPERNGML